MRTVLAAVLFLLPLPLLAHETNFGLSPHTVYKRGWMTEFHILHEEADRHGHRERETEAEAEFHYGVEAHLTLGFGLAWERLREAAHGPSERESGSGDVTLIGKYRVLKFDDFLATDYVSLITEYTLATAPRGTHPARGEGGDAGLVGLGYSRIRKFWAGWLDAGTRFHERGHGLKPGRETVADVAVGWRPRVAEIDQMDFQVVLELNYEHQDRARDRDGRVENSGRSVLFLSPGLRFGRGVTIWNLAVQIPVDQSRPGDQPETRYRLKLGVEHLF